MKKAYLSYLICKPNLNLISIDIKRKQVYNHTESISRVESCRFIQIKPQEKLSNLKYLLKSFVYGPWIDRHILKQP